MDEKIGEIIGNYRIIRKLGQGAFSEVYLAEEVGLEADLLKRESVQTSLFFSYRASSSGRLNLMFSVVASALVFRAGNHPLSVYLFGNVAISLMLARLVGCFLVFSIDMVTG